jgi:hypothetical protein
MKPLLRILSTASAVALLGAAPVEKSAWTVTHLAGKACRLDADKATLSDGYQTTSALVQVSPTEVRVVSESVFDPGKEDLLIQVDKKDPVKSDGLGEGNKTVIFKTQAPLLIEQFKAGLRARVQLRFWPSWPETGNHSVEVSLIGFTKAWDEMQESCH